MSINSVPSKALWEDGTDGRTDTGELLLANEH